MKGRRNSVKVGELVSPSVPVSTGVGEGSVLGPLIFLICILEVLIVMELVKERMEEIKLDMVEDVDLHSVQFANDKCNCDRRSPWSLEFVNLIYGLISCPAILMTKSHVNLILSLTP